MTYPTISHFIEQVIGVFIPLPIQTFGFFILLAFIVGRYFIYLECQRLENLQIFKPIKVLSKKSSIPVYIEYVINGLMSFLFGYKILYIIQNYTEFSHSPQETLLSKEGNLLLGIMFLLISITYIYISDKKTNNKINITIKPSELSWNFIFIAAISGIIGAKLFAVLEDIPYLLENPLNALLSFSGLTFYGGFITGTICVILYAKKYNIDVLRLADVFAPALILAYGIGRLGCHFSGDGDWGVIADLNNKPFFFPDWLWGYNFPHNVIEAGVKIDDCIGKYCYELPHLVHPTSLYEAIFGLIAFIFLWNIKTYINIKGMLFCIYLILNGVERFLIEIIRVTEKYMMVGLNITQAQIIGLILILIGITGIIYLKQKKTHELI